jgi:hypothetical protein
MKIFKIILVTVATFYITTGFSQTNEIGFYFQPEYSAMFLDDHIGNAVGVGIGITTKNKKWDIGVRTYGRSGPINTGQLYDLVLPEGTTYKGKSILKVANDQGFLGLEIAYNLELNSERLMIRFPVSFGQFGAGFYLLDDDRITPDGRRVNEWEDELQEGSDAGFGLLSEFGSQIIYHVMPDKHFNLFMGITYTNTYGYSSFLGGEDFYNNKLRGSIGIRVGF